MSIFLPFFDVPFFDCYGCSSVHMCLQVIDQKVPVLSSYVRSVT